MHAVSLALPGGILALAAMAIVAALLPSRPALGAALDRLRATASPGDADARANWDARVGLWVHARLPDLPVFAIPEKDLRIVGVSTELYFRDKTLLAVLGLVAPSIFGIIMSALGYLPLSVPLLLGLPLSAALWFAPDRSIRARAQAARTEFARAVAVYLELVAAERKRGAPAGRALSSAAEVGSTWVFARIRDELARARLAGTAPWTALGGLADEIDVPELADVAKIVRLSGEEGASVADSLRGRGKTLRTQLLADEHTKANRASERMSVPLTFLAFVFVGIVLTPLVLNLLN